MVSYVSNSSSSVTNDLPVETMSAPQSDTEKLSDAQPSGQTMSVLQPDIERPAHTEKPAPESMPWHPSQYPDGGLQAWLVVAGHSAVYFVASAWINCMFDTPVFY